MSHTVNKLYVPPINDVLCKGFALFESRTDESREYTNPFIQHNALIEILHEIADEESYDQKAMSFLWPAVNDMRYIGFGAVNFARSEFGTDRTRSLEVVARSATELLFPTLLPDYNFEWTNLKANWLVRFGKNSVGVPLLPLQCLEKRTDNEGRDTIDYSSGALHSMDTLILSPEQNRGCPARGKKLEKTFNRYLELMFPIARSEHIAEPSQTI